jgi:hypothetical protein
MEPLNPTPADQFCATSGSDSAASHHLDPPIRSLDDPCHFLDPFQSRRGATGSEQSLAACIDNLFQPENPIGTVVESTVKGHGSAIASIQQPAQRLGIDLSAVFEGTENDTLGPCSDVAGDLITHPRDIFRVQDEISGAQTGHRGDRDSRLDRSAEGAGGGSEPTKIESTTHLDSIGPGSSAGGCKGRVIDTYFDPYNIRHDQAHPSAGIPLQSTPSCEKMPRDDVGNSVPLQSS